MRDLLRDATNALDLRKVIKRLELRVPIEKDPALDKVRQRSAELVGRMSSRRDCEDIVELFECSLLGFCFGRGRRRKK
jgi:hypothetical protein